MALADSTRMRAARAQSLAAVAFLMIVAALVAALDTAAHNSLLAAWVDDQKEARRRASHEPFSRDGFFLEFGDQLLYEQLPTADYSRGGVVLIGDSKVRYAARLWKLPHAQQALIHNYAIGNTCHKLHFEFLRFLVDQEGLLRAGGEKTLVICGASYSNGQCHDEYFKEVWRRHGFFRYSADTGIQRVAMPAWKQLISRERVRISGLFSAVQRLVSDVVASRSRSQTLRVHRPESYNDNRREYMGSNWEADMDEQLREFGRMLDFLAERNVKTAVVLMPMGSWDMNLPYQDRYNAAMTALCREKHVPLYDWAALLDDEEFGDQAHANYLGAEKLTQKFGDLALDHLVETGALPGR
jgi:hypothetical protein